MVIHLLKLIRSRLGGSCWILVELLVVFVILWFMMYYFVAQGMLTRMRWASSWITCKRDARHTAVRQSLVHRLRGGERGAGAEHRAYRGAYRAHPDVEVVGLSYYSLPYTD